MTIVPISEFKAVGLQINGMDSDGNVSWASTPNNELAMLLIYAHEKGSGSPEITALRDHLGVESVEWVAYVEARKQPVQQARQLRYREETDALRLKADEDHTIGSDEWLAAIEAWKAAKEAIRLELPYEVE